MTAINLVKNSTNLKFSKKISLGISAICSQMVTKRKNQILHQLFFGKVHSPISSLLNLLQQNKRQQHCIEKVVGSSGFQQSHREAHRNA